MSANKVLAPAALGALVVVGLGSIAGDPRKLMEVLLVFAMAQGWNLLCGYTGLLSFGHQAFIGVGAYALFIVTNHLGLSPYLALAASAGGAMLVALLMAGLLNGLRDAYFSIGIWVLADCLRLFFGQWQLAGGSRGLILDPSAVDPSTLNHVVLWLAAALAIATLLGMFLLLRARFGLALMAIRDDERAAAGVGVSIRRNRLVAFLMSAGICGLAGGIYYLSVLYVDPVGAFDLAWQIRILFIVIVGGVGTLEGPFVGTLIYYVLRSAFQGHGEWFAMCEGAVAAAIMLLAPYGIWGYFAQRFGWRVFALAWA